MEAVKVLPVSRVAARLRCSRDTVLRLLESGELQGYRLTSLGWWRVLESSLLEYEASLLQQCESEPDPRTSVPPLALRRS
jgi:excisionase family DNA binding protein